MLMRKDWIVEEFSGTPALSNFDLSQRKRKLGAYFTPDILTRVLCNWAIRSPNEKILEPSFGGCGFLESAATRLDFLGAQCPTQNLFGCDIDSSAFRHLSNRMGVKVGKNFLHSDFLAIKNPRNWPSQFNVVIGNPPYVSYHNLSAEQRNVAKHALTSTSSISLPRMASLWAYFLIRSVNLICEEGRIAFILPRSFIDADYSRILRRYVGSHFERSIVFLMKPQFFKKEGAEERTVCLLAEGKRSPCSNYDIHIAEIENTEELAERIDRWQRGTWDGHIMPERPGLALMKTNPRKDYERLENLPCCIRLSEKLKIRIGLVTGANEFFLFSLQQARERGISLHSFVPVVSKFFDLPGLIFTPDDHAISRESNDTCLLLSPSKKAAASAPVNKYLKEFPQKKRANNKTFKKRDLWYCPDDQRRPDAFLSYMQDMGPRICLNSSNANCTNTIHRIFFEPTLPMYKRKLLTISLLTTFSQLSAEIEGRSYGSGVLKHEPSEAGKIQVLIPPALQVRDVNRIFSKIDDLVRENQLHSARELADEFILRSQVGADADDIIASLANELERYRTSRRRPESIITNNS